jgi:hypothetical protein
VCSFIPLSPGAASAAWVRGSLLECICGLERRPMRKDPSSERRPNTPKPLPAGSIALRPPRRPLQRDFSARRIRTRLPASPSSRPCFSRGRSTTGESIRSRRKDGSSRSSMRSRLSSWGQQLSASRSRMVSSSLSRRGSHLLFLSRRQLRRLWKSYVAVMCITLSAILLAFGPVLLTTRSASSYRNEPK